MSKVIPFWANHRARPKLLAALVCTQVSAVAYYVNKSISRKQQLQEGQQEKCLKQQ